MMAHRVKFIAQLAAWIFVAVVVGHTFVALAAE